MPKKATEQIAICIGDILLVCIPEANLMYVGQVQVLGDEGAKSIRLQLAPIDVDEPSTRKIH